MRPEGKYAWTVTVGEKGQIVIPKQARELFGIQPGDNLVMLADKDKGERFEIFGHVLAEFFNPGDYFETDRPGYFLRWQVELKF